MKRYLIAATMILAVAGFSFAFPHDGIKAPVETQSAEAIQSGLSFALNNAPDRHAVAFVSQVNDSRMTLVPLKTYQTNFGQTCRQYSFDYSAETGGSAGVGVACQGRDGNWQVITMQGDKGSVRNAGGSCPYTSGNKSQLKGVASGQDNRYHSEEFLRQHKQLLERQQMRQKNGLQLVAN